MKVVHLVAGAGGMYCGACLHGNTLAAALGRAGHDALLVPVYTPIRTDEEDVSIGRVVYGGLNVYLQQRSRLFEHTPEFLDRLLDRPGLLRRVSQRGSSVRAESLGELTVSMLQGEEGRQRKELDKLTRWLVRDARPDVVHLSTVLLTGMALQISRRLGVPVVSTLSGEDVFLERLPEPHYSKARGVLRERCRDLAGMIALNRYYGGFMAEYLAAPADRIHVIAPGLNLLGHAVPGGGGRRPDAERGDAERGGLATTIGFLSRICPDKGLHVLADAFCLLSQDRSLGPLELRAAGYLAEGDRPYLAGIEARLAASGLADRFEYLGSPDRAGKIAFLQSLDVMCLPTVYRESKALAVLEAWANGVPVVVPAHGVFPELIEETGGGLLCKPNDPGALADALRRLIQDPGLAAELGRRAHEAVHQRFHADLMAQRTAALYETLCRVQGA